MKHSPAFFAVLIFYCISSLLFSQGVYSQDFSSIDSDLQQLENLITDTLSNSETQQRLLEDLRQNLASSGNLIENYESTITEQESLLKNLEAHLAEMSETYRKQSALSAKYEKSSKFWKTFTLIAIPVTALISGGIVWGITAGR